MGKEPLIARGDPDRWIESLGPAATEHDIARRISGKTRVAAP
jgi:hypothetical protein